MANQHTKKNAAAQAVASKPGTLVAKAETLQHVKDALKETAERLAKTAAEGASLQRLYDSLIADHKKAQSALADEALLIKPE